MVTTNGNSGSSVDCVFVSDFFTNDLPSPGGGELSDAELIQYLESKSLSILKVRCQKVTETISDENIFFILSAIDIINVILFKNWDRTVRRFRAWFSGL